MKRLICLLLCFLMLSGCSITGERIKEPVRFYYVKDGFEKDMAQVIGSEVREASGHSKDLSYLLALYSMGPSQENLKSTLPRNTLVIPTEHTSERLVLTVSDTAQSLTDTDFTLAATCLAMTCIELIDIVQVTVVCGDRSIDIQTENLLLQHTLTEKPQEDIK